MSLFRETLNFLKKIKIPRFFNTKKFFVLAGLFALFFLFTPISLHQAGNKLEDFLNARAKEGVKAFERQTGLKIEWRLLNFKWLTMSVELENVQIIPLNTANFQRIQELKLLDGLQRIQKVSARPSILSLLIEKRIVLSKLSIDGGDIYLKSSKIFLKRAKRPKDMDLPIKRMLIRSGNLSLSHRGHILRFSGVRSSVAQRRGGIFHFNLFVGAFQIKKSGGFESFQAPGSYLSRQNGKGDLPPNETYQLAFRGLAERGKVSFGEISLKGQGFQSLTQKLDIYFDSKGLKSFSAKSSGALPFSLIQKGMDLTGGGDPIFSDSLLFYKLSAQYKKPKGFTGFFEAKGQNAVFKSRRIKSFSLKASLRDYLLTADRGFVEIQNQGRARIKKGEWLFKGASARFSFSLEADRLSSDFVSRAVLNIKDAPVKGDFTGLIECRGTQTLSFLNCFLKGKSEKAWLELNNQNEIAALYGMSLDSSLEWKDQVLKFSVSGEKGSSAKVDFDGQYIHPLGRLESSCFFWGKAPEDLSFSAPFPFEGRLEAQEGQLAVEKGKVRLSGFISSPLARLQSYTLRNVSGSFRLEDSQLDFFDMKGAPGRSNWTGDVSIDFKKERAVFNIDSPFFALEDFFDSIKENINWTTDLKGAGAVSFFLDLPWAAPERLEFQLKGDLFNVSVGRDMFQQATFDLGSQKGKGEVRSLFLRKGQGYIKGAGDFDNKESLNLSLDGKNLSLERWEWLNEILPFNQSGDMDFKMKITGSPRQPKIESDVFVSNMFFYSYPADDSSFKLRADRKALSFSGRVMDKINIDKFIYPFSKEADIEIEGHFADLDFIRLIFSKNRMERARDYSSQITGSFSFSKKSKKQKLWTGQAKISDFLVSKSNKWIKSEGPFSVFFEKGRWSFTSARFSHNDNKKLFIQKKGEGKALVAGASSLGLFSVFFPFLREFEGDIEGQLLIDNNLKKPRPKGSLRIKRGMVSIKPLPDFTNARASLSLSENDISINNFQSQAGGGGVKGGGAIIYDFENPPVLNLNLSFSEARLNIPEDFNTRGSGDIKITGKKPPYLISGQYLIDSGAITKDFSGGLKRAKYDFSVLSEKKTKQPDIFGLKLGIQTKKPVAVSASLIRSSVEGQADIYGPLSSLLMSGEFALSKTKGESLIFFRGQEFEIKDGSILFIRSPPDNPYLNIKADTLFKEQIIDPLAGNQEIERVYKIFLSLKGPSQDPDFSLKSAPALSEREIISLLTLGVGSKHFDANVKQNVADYSYQILASMLLEKPLNKEIKDALGVDFRLTPYINTLNRPVTKITLSKKWFEKWKSSFSRTIEDAQSDVRLKYDLNKKISLTAFWETAGQAEIEENQDDWMGLDFEFNFDF